MKLEKKVSVFDHASFGMMSDSMYECNPQRVGFNALCEIIRNLHCLLSQTQLVNELYIY